MKAVSLRPHSAILQRQGILNGQEENDLAGFYPKVARLPPAELSC